MKHRFKLMIITVLLLAITIAFKLPYVCYVLVQFVVMLDFLITAALFERLYPDDKVVKSVYVALLVILLFIVTHATLPIIIWKFINMSSIIIAIVPLLFDKIRKEDFY